MHPRVHIPVSLSAAALIYAHTGSVAAGVVCVASGVLVDIDHFIDYAIRFLWNRFSRGGAIHRFQGEVVPIKIQERRWEKHLFVHSIECAILSWVFYAYTDNLVLFGFAVGYSIHLILDVIGNHWKRQLLRRSLCFNVYCILRWV